VRVCACAFYNDPDSSCLKSLKSYICHFFKITNRHLHYTATQTAAFTLATSLTRPRPPPPDARTGHARDVGEGREAVEEVAGLVDDAAHGGLRQVRPRVPREVDGCEEIRGWNRSQISLPPRVSQRSHKRGGFSDYAVSCMKTKCKPMYATITIAPFLNNKLLLRIIRSF